MEQISVCRKVKKLENWKVGGLEKVGMLENWKRLEGWKIERNKGF